MDEKSCVSGRPSRNGPSPLHSRAGSRLGWDQRAPSQGTAPQPRRGLRPAEFPGRGAPKHSTKEHSFRDRRLLEILSKYTLFFPYVSCKISKVNVSFIYRKMRSLRTVTELIVRTTEFPPWKTGSSVNTTEELERRRSSRIRPGQPAPAASHRPPGPGACRRETALVQAVSAAGGAAPGADPGHSLLGTVRQARKPLHGQLLTAPHGREVGVHVPLPTSPRPRPRPPWP